MFCAWGEQPSGDLVNRLPCTQPLALHVQRHSKLAGSAAMRERGVRYHVDVACAARKALGGEATRTSEGSWAMHTMHTVPGAEVVVQGFTSRKKQKKATEVLPGRQRLSEVPPSLLVEFCTSTRGSK